MSTQAAQGQAAIKARDYTTAIQKLTEALSTSDSPLWRIQRALSYQRTNQHELALIDGEAAVLGAQKRGKRELIAEAQFRRALALQSLKRYGDARKCLLWASDKNDKLPGLTMWMGKVKTDWEKAEAEQGEHSEQCRVVIKEYPDAVQDVGAKESKITADEAKKPANIETPKPALDAAAPSTPAATPASLQQTPKDKIRTDWYQSNQTISLSILAKGVPKKDAQVIIKENSLEVLFPIGESSEYTYSIDPLFAKIDPAASSFRITPHKIEIILQKAVQGLKWSSIEGTETDVSSLPEIVAKVPEEKKKESAPVYPTSSRTGPKNWDAVGEEGDEKGDGVDDFFKTLFKNADDDTKKAMMKSYQESNGTALSTNWADVKKGPVETKPPEGLVARKWGE